MLFKYIGGNRKWWIHLFTDCICR